MVRQEALEVTRLHSVAGLLSGGGLIQFRPFRAPHHSIAVRLLGGGSGFLAPGRSRWPNTASAVLRARCHTEPRVMMLDVAGEDEGEVWAAYTPVGEGPSAGWRMSVREARRRAKRER